MYRQAHGITDLHVALGDMSANNPELRMFWEQTHRDLEIPPDEVGVRAKSRAELEGKVHAYARAAETAPPDMGRQLGYHRTQAAGLQRQAEQAEAGGDLQLASDSRAAAAEEARQADQLSAGQDTRDAWDRAYEAKRLAARAARQELDRRGIEPEPERHESESLTGWWRQFEADADAADRALDRQRQTAINKGQPWPPKAGTIAKTPEPEAQQVIERLRRDGYLPGLNLKARELQAGIPELGPPGPAPELRAEPGSKTHIGERIDASIRRVRQVGERAAADVEAQRQERSGYAARIAQQAQHEAEADYGPSSQAENRSAEADYEPEI